MRRTKGLVFTVIALMVCPPAFGACTVSATAVSFGTYDTLNPGNDDSVGTITSDCNKGDRDPVASINGGSSGSIAVRELRSGANILNYNLYTTPARNIIFGDGITGSTVLMNFVNSAGGVRHYDATVYGRIPPLQPVVAGVYVDTVTVTITY